MNYYDTHIKSIANSKEIKLSDEIAQHFPSEGLFIGTLRQANIEIPALILLSEIDGFGILYNDAKIQNQAYRLIENIVWRLALTVPSHLCDIVMYNGGIPGDVFNLHRRLNRFICGGRDERVFFDGTVSDLKRVLEQSYKSIMYRMSVIKSAGKASLVELNESLGDDAKIKYQFIVLTDFPNGCTSEIINLLTHIAEAGREAGVYLILSWDMNAIFDQNDIRENRINPTDLLQKLEMLVPEQGKLVFKNTSNDEVRNQFALDLDDQEPNNEYVEQILKYVNNKVENAVKSKPISTDLNQLLNAPYASPKNGGELSITVGVDLEDKHPITFRFDDDTYLHTFVLGQSGSGKSVMLHHIITSLILKYSPNDLMLYLMDFKGTEFQRYKGLRHTKAVLVENSDHQLSLEILNDLNKEIKRRSELLGTAGQISSYNRSHPNDHLPQIIVVIDECQQLFNISNAESTTTQTQKRKVLSLVDKVFQQGRSYGIHMLLSTQQLGDANLSDSVLSNLTDHFLMMCSPQDANRLVPDSGDKTSVQKTFVSCYYHKKQYVSQLQTFLTDRGEMAKLLLQSQEKTSNEKSHGAHYFSGKEKVYLKDNFALIQEQSRISEVPTILLGKQVCVEGDMLSMSFPNDFEENILCFGTNDQEQAISCMMNTIASIMISNRERGNYTDYIFIDCCTNTDFHYKQVLADWESQGLCRLVSRKESGKELYRLVQDIKSKQVQSTILTIIGQEQYAEMRRDMPIFESINMDSSSKDNWSSSPIERTDEEKAEIERILKDQPNEQVREMMREQLYGGGGFKSASEDEINNMQTTSFNDTEDTNLTYQEALKYILENGSYDGVHVLMQVNNPSNIFFEGTGFSTSTTNYFKHRIILRSEEKYIRPMQIPDVDVESLSTDLGCLRAVYNKEDKIILFTPLQMIDSNILNL